MGRQAHVPEGQRLILPLLPPVRYLDGHREHRLESLDRLQRLHERNLLDARWCQLCRVPGVDHRLVVVGRLVVAPGRRCGGLPVSGAAGAAALPAPEGAAAAPALASAALAPASRLAPLPALYGSRAAASHPAATARGAASAV